MAYKGRIVQQVENAIRVLKDEGSIIIPMSLEKYEEHKAYKICIMEQIHEVQRGQVNWTAQMLLFERIIDELERKNINYIHDYKEGIIRLK